MLGVFPGVGSPGRSGCHGRRSASTRGWRTVPRNPRRVRRRSRSWIRSNGWSTSGRVADRFMPRIAASYGQARVRLAGRRAGVRRLVSDRAAVCEALEAGASRAGRGVLGAGVVAGGDAGGFRAGAGRGRREPDGRALPGGLVPAFEHAVCGGPSRGERGVRAPWGCAWCSTMPGSRRWSWCPYDATGAGHRVAWDGITVVDVSPAVRSGITGSRPGSAIPPAAGRRAVWRTRSGSCAAM